MTIQELEQKFNLIGNIILRNVVKHLYDPGHSFRFIYCNRAEVVLYRAFNWYTTSPYGEFWEKIHDCLIDDPNYSFSKKELQQVQEAYPELFFSDGNLKGEELVAEEDTVLTQLRKHLNSISTEQFEKEWQEIVSKGVESPTLEEFMQRSKKIQDELVIDYEVIEFATAMQKELDANAHKGDLFNWDITNDFPKWLYEFEYHKSKLIAALMAKDENQKKEYCADLANYLLLLFNTKDVNIQKSVTLTEKIPLP